MCVKRGPDRRWWIRYSQNELLTRDVRLLAARVARVTARLPRRSRVESKKRLFPRPDLAEPNQKVAVERGRAVYEPPCASEVPRAPVVRDELSPLRRWIASPDSVVERCAPSRQLGRGLGPVDMDEFAFFRLATMRFSSSGPLRLAVAIQFENQDASDQPTSVDPRFVGSRRGARSHTQPRRATTRGRRVTRTRSNRLEA